jgi:diacylglycerol kinase
MKKNNTFLKSVSNAFCGVKYFFLNETNGKIQLVVAIILISFSICLNISTTECLFVVVCIGLVIGLEMLNTAIENLSNVVQEAYHPVIKIIKDVAAAAVLWAAFISIIIGCIIFLPKIF